MAVCIDPACGLEMTASVGCLVTEYEIAGAARQRIPNTSGHRCHDCAAPDGTMHHPGCDRERCPVCGDQAISCDCCDCYEEED